MSIQQETESKIFAFFIDLLRCLYNTLALPKSYVYRLLSSESPNVITYPLA